MNQAVQEKVDQWLNGDYDKETKDKIRQLQSENEKELIDAFYKDLDFGTGGLRGIMGVGTNRMNKYTVAKSTQGLANHMKKHFTGLAEIKMAIAYDSRIDSDYFARIIADVLSANEIRVSLFKSLRTTPELSFAVRELKCQGGIVITASHNPKEYNGYKVYWDDGAQVVSPHDKDIIGEVNRIKDLSEIHFNGVEERIHEIGEEIDELYFKKVRGLSVNPELIKEYADFPIVYTPLHGTGGTAVPQTLALFGFKNVHLVEEQHEPDGNFPTVSYPNPEEAAALELAVRKAKKVEAELVMANDPDTDRVGIAVKDGKGEYILLNGNQTGAMLVEYMLKAWQEKSKLTGKEFVAKTIVTTELIQLICDKYAVECYDVLTGFKYIADLIRKFEGEKKFIVGGEESYGYLAGDFVRDKDAVSASCLIAEMAVSAKHEGLSLLEKLKAMYVEHGYYKESLVSMTKKGKDGAEAIKKMMESHRSRPPEMIAGEKIVEMKDYLSSICKDLSSGHESEITLPSSNVLQFSTNAGTKITMRPSGTEPKIKFYIAVKGELKSVEDYDRVTLELEQKMNWIKKDLNLDV